MPSGRRSSRNRKENSEIVAPGFGTSSDISKLSRDLGGGKMSKKVVTAVMRSEGRGIRGRSQAEDNPLTSPQTSSAWADFLQEEGGGVSSSVLNFDTSAKDEEPSNKRRKTEKSVAPASSGKVEYDLSVLTTASKSPPCGALVQSGTLDSTLVGRKSIKSTDEAVYHLNIPTSLLPKISIAKVCTSCNAAHAIAIDKSNNAYGWGRNEGMTLGSSLGEGKVVPTPQIIASDIQTAALGKSHTIFLQMDGTLHAQVPTSLDSVDGHKVPKNRGHSSRVR